MTNELLKSVNSTVRSNPDAVAYEVLGEGKTSYQELWSRASAIARALLAETDGRGPVVVLGRKSATTVACFLGCLMSGHAYVPVDSELPAARIRSITAQISDVLVLSAVEVSDELAGLVPAETLLDARAIADKASASVEPPSESIWVSGEETQYIIFTSGSTGRPKGIEVSAANVANFMRWVDGFPVIAKGGQVFLDQAPYSFDLSEYELVGALSTGGCLHALPASLLRDHVGLLNDLDSAGVTVWVSTPSFVDFCLTSSRFTCEALPDVRLFLFCGETLHHTTVSALAERFPSALVANTYGPTESTVAVTFGLMGPRDLADPAPLHVGVARPGTEIRIVDRKTGARCPAGFSGEIVIAGDTVAKGYYNNPEKTRSAFFESRMADGTPVRAYRTGDIGHLDSKGRLHCEGRTDSFIKLNGFRIELGEIEGTLEELPGVEQAAVVAVEKDGRIHHLRAFAVLDQRDPSQDFAEKRRIKAQLASHLPSYMVPRVITILDEMPLTANGKINRKELVGA